MTFNAKLRRIGNSMGVLIPKDVLDGKEGDWIELEIVKDTDAPIDEKDLENLDRPKRKKLTFKL